MGRCSQGRRSAMSNFRERLRTLKTDLWVRPISRTRFIRCAFFDGCKRFLHCWLFSHPKLVTLRCLLPEGRVARTSLRVYVTTFGSLGMEIGGGPWFWREENITVLEAHSICMPSGTRREIIRQDLSFRWMPAELNSSDKLCL